MKVLTKNLGYKVNILIAQYHGYISCKNSCD